MNWIWQRPNWPVFTWKMEKLTQTLRSAIQSQGLLLGKVGSIEENEIKENCLDNLLQNIITSSAIEGEILNVQSVRSSLAKRLGVADNKQSVHCPITERTEGLADLLLDAIQNIDQPLTLDRLFTWHGWLFPSSELGLKPHQIGCLRGHEPMQVISGRIGNPTIHFQAPPREGLESALSAFIDWFNQSQQGTSLDPLVRAGIAHFWFITLHPFEDGNGRLARFVTDLALAQSDQQSIRWYTMSKAILEHRSDYYRILEQSQRNDLDITPWLAWFLTTLQTALSQALAHIDRVLDKARFWQRYHHQRLLPEQVKVLNRLLDGGARGFEQGISASQYQKVAKISKASATRHLTDLLAKGCLEKLPGSGRSTRYQIPKQRARG